MAIPYFQKLQREGESGRRKINNITRYLTILITGGQAPGYIANLKATLPETAFLLGDGAFLDFFYYHFNCRYNFCNVVRRKNYR